MDMHTGMHAWHQGLGAQGQRARGPGMLQGRGQDKGVQQQAPEGIERRALHDCAR